MGRRRGFLPPPVCEQCGAAPSLGETLWPGAQWRCSHCFKDSLPGTDYLSKSMHQMMEYREGIQDAIGLESEGAKAHGPRNQAEWARRVAAELKKDGQARSRQVRQAQGEAVPSDAPPYFHDTLTVPDLASVEASFARTKLLLNQGPGVAAMALDAADSIQAQNSLEKMLVHQLTTLHHVTMEQLALISSRQEATSRRKHLHAAAKCQSVFQAGLLSLKKLRQTGHQRILVQYVNVSEGGQAVIGNIERGSGE